jgi:hypothetical protein
MRAVAHSTRQTPRLDGAPLPAWESFPADRRQQVIQWIVQVARRQLPGAAANAAQTDGR